MKMMSSPGPASHGGRRAAVGKDGTSPKAQGWSRESSGIQGLGDRRKQGKGAAARWEQVASCNPECLGKKAHPIPKAVSLKSWQSTRL